MATEKSGSKIKISFTQQQRELLEKIRREEKFGNTYEEVVVNVFRDYVKQEVGR